MPWSSRSFGFCRLPKGFMAALKQKTRRPSLPVRDSRPMLTTCDRSFDSRQNRELADAMVAVGVEEGVVIAERDAAIGIAIRAEHVGVREQAFAAEDRLFAADRGQP